MGGYGSKPITEKVSEGGEFTKKNITVIYGATAMQGWRIAMEDAHSIVPDFDEDSSLFGVYDGHGGREVAVYCATHMPDIIRACYRGDIGKALKDAFMKCDRMVIEEDAVKEMRTYDDICADGNDVDSKEELDNLLEESAMPLQSLLARYNAPLQADSRSEEREDLKRRGINSILKLLSSTEVELDTSSDDAEEEEEEDEDGNKRDDADPASEEDGAEEQVSSTTQEDTELVSQEDCIESLDSREAGRTAAGNATTFKNSKPEHLPDSSNSSSTNATTSHKSIPERMLKREESTNKFNLLDLLTSRPLEASSPTRSRKRQCPDGDHEDIEERSPKKSNPRGLAKQGYRSGTTAVVGILREKEFIVSNAGDSKCVLSSRGKAVDMSVDHKPTDELELHRIENAGGHVGPDERVNGGLNLSRAIGDHFYKENFSLSLEDQMISAMPDIKSVPLTDDNDFIVFACDGIWNSLTSQEVVDFVCSRLNLKANNEKPTPDELIKICESMCDNCMAANTDNDGVGCDNMTCIIIYLAR